MADIDPGTLEHIMVAIQETTTWERFQWAGRCERVNSALETELLKENLGEVEFECGDWTGPVHPNSPFARQQNARGTPLPGKNPVFHCWVELPDGRVADATRWAFYAGQEPYIYLGERDHYSTERYESVIREAIKAREAAWKKT